MTHFKLVKQGAALAFLATLVSGAAVVSGATPASADWRCTGRIEVSATSRARAYVAYYFRNGGGSAITKGEGPAIGTEASPIVYYGTPADRSFSVSYYDLTITPNAYITTHHLDHGGSFAINPCHRAIVSVH
jgi:hypothetical protein